MWPARRQFARRRIRSGLARPVDRRRHRRARRLRQRAAAAAARSRRDRAAARKPFIGYSDLTALLDLPDDSAAAWSRFTGRCSAGRLATRRGRLRSRLVRAGAVPAASRWASWRRAGLETIRAGRSERPAPRRHGDAAAGVARHAVRLRRRRAATCCFSTRSASGRIDSIAWSRSFARPVCLRARRRGRDRRAAAMRRAVGRAHGARGDGRSVRRLSRTGAVRISVRPHAPARR